MELLTQWEFLGNPHGKRLKKLTLGNHTAGNDRKREKRDRSNLETCTVIDLARRGADKEIQRPKIQAWESNKDRGLHNQYSPCLEEKKNLLHRSSDISLMFWSKLDSKIPGLSEKYPRGICVWLFKVVHLQNILKNLRLAANMTRLHEKLYPTFGTRG